MSWRIEVKVSGGVTGTRYGWLKSNGKPVTFDDQAAAARQARDYMTKRNTNQATAQFSARAVEN